MNLNSVISKKHCLALAVAAFMAVPLAQAADVNISGFLSVGGGMVDKEIVLDDGTLLSYDGYSEKDFTFNHNILGLQVSGQVNEKITATAQIIARTENDYETSAEWAYLTWQATDTSKVRAGRLRTPLYMYSDYLDVGYSYPWISAPEEVYYLAFNNVDGIDYYVNIPVGSFDASFQAYFGGFDGDFELDGAPSSVSARNQVGVAATIGRDWWTVRAAYHQNEISLDVGTPEFQTMKGALLGSPALEPYATNILVDEDKATFAEVGINIDTGRFVMAAEYIEFEVENSFLAKNIRNYVMGGVRFGDFLFHATFSQTDDEIASDADDGLPLPEGHPLLTGIRKAIADRDNQRDVMTYGIRWDVISGTALKLQFDDVNDELQGDQKVVSVAVQAVF